jgi:hypothetical protein
MLGSVGTLYLANTSAQVVNVFFPPMAQQPLVGQGLLNVEASRSHSDTPHCVGVIWMSDQPHAEAPTWQHITVTTDRHPHLRRDSNPQSKETSRLLPISLGRSATGIGTRCEYHLLMSIGEISSRANADHYAPFSAEKKAYNLGPRPTDVLTTYCLIKQWDVTFIIKPLSWINTLEETFWQTETDVRTVGYWIWGSHMAQFSR